MSNPSLIIHLFPQNPPKKSSKGIKLKKKINSNTRKTKKNKKRHSKNKNNTKPNWLELPEDIWFLILSKLKTIDIIENAQKVCMLFRKLCKLPSMFKKIDMYLTDEFNCLPYDVNSMTRFAVDRSSGQLLDIYLEYLCDDQTLMYIAERSPNLRHLRLGHYIYVSDDGLIEAVQKLPMLEEVQLIVCSFAEDTMEALGHNLPFLKSFSIAHDASSSFDYVGNEEALGIAKSMPQLRHLQLIGNFMSNEGLKAILDGCPLLESLDLRRCFNIDLSGDLGERCKAIKNLRLPHDSTKDYDHLIPKEEEEEAFAYGWSDDDNDFTCDDYPIYPGFNDFGIFEDEYPDYFDDCDDFGLGYDYFGFGDFLDYDHDADEEEMSDYGYEDQESESICDDSPPSPIDKTFEQEARKVMEICKQVGLSVKGDEEPFIRRIAKDLADEAKGAKG